MPNEKIIGIDFGTTNSVVAIKESGEIIVIPNKRGNRLTPSAFAISKNNELLIGEVAKNQAVLNPENTVLSIKRYMGKDYKVKIQEKEFTPQEIAAMIIRELKASAEKFLETEITKAVITVPAYFNDNQRQATKDAGKIAGLDVLRIINEPTAAALAYGITNKDAQTVLVYDLGGGTFDVSILEIGSGVYEVIATNGNNFLGGDDFDNKIMEFLVNKFYDETKIDLTKDRMALQKLKEEAENAKKILSDAEIASINIPFITADESGPKHLQTTISRDMFNEITKDLVEATLEPIFKALEDAHKHPDDIDKILLVGGSTRMPIIQETLEKVLNKKPSKVLNPDECVAVGAAIQASILSGTDKGIVLVDVIPLTLGVKNEPDIFVPIIKRNTPIPVCETNLFTTVSDNQSVVEIHILQGERKIASENVSLGKFQLEGIRPGRAGEPRIEVKFEVDVNGILNVSARDIDTNVKQEIKIQTKNRLTDEQIKEMIKKAEELLEQDTRAVNLQKLRLKVEQEIRIAKTFLKELELDETLEKELKNLIQELEQIKNSDKLEEIQLKYEALEYLNNEIKLAQNKR
ncbi:MAG TPA: molecular chaperone DnaK [bacterium]|nr:molecular chaperone DnaK [bacterium]HPQ17829.1 molecular chaperone DnaK [bacterium]